MNLAERTRIQLDHKQQALLKEFDYWRNNSNPGTSLAKHNSQIRSITGAVEAFLKSLPGMVRDDEPLEKSNFRFKGLLYANHMWAFFRSKFALRLVDSNTGYSIKRMLNCADEFAWNCYEPARTQARKVGVLQPDDLKEPPLTFFASDAGPYMAQRNALFSAEGIAGRSQNFKRFNTTLEQLPVPIIGIPWSQSNHLPTTVVVAHEVGHLVERDFSASAGFAKGILTVAGIDDNRRSHWLNWASELFADTYAILCTGPAYLIALMDYLVAPEHIVEHETLDEKSAETYPTRALRIAFNLAVLELLDLPDEGIGQLWSDAYPHPSLSQYDEYCRDVSFVAKVFLETPLDKFGGFPVTQVMKMTPDDWDEIKQKGQHLLKAQELGIHLKDNRRFQTWFAAATWAYYSDPDSFVKVDAQYLLLNRLKSTILGTTRGSSQTGVTAMTPTAIEKAGQVILEHFMKLEGGETP